MSKQLFLTLSLACMTMMASAEIKVSYVSLADDATYCANPVKCYAQPTSFDEPAAPTTMRLYPEITFQTLRGVGGCFNEIGGEALASLDKAEQQKVLDALFGEDGAGFEFCRMSIGSSDFGIDAYSYSEKADDYKMKHFSMKREKEYMMPYIKSAVATNPNIKIFGSPWSPPAWMKESGYMDRGREFTETNVLKDDPKIYEAYALYFAKYVEAYEAEGIDIERVVIQNEQDFSNRYPTCDMSVEQMVKFTRGYLRPTFEKRGIPCEIWAGTFRTHGEIAALELAAKPEDLALYDGIGIQYTTPRYITDMVTLAPTTPMMHTECVCKNGTNTIEHAAGRLNEVATYINAGSQNFAYWNMILNETGRSGWDWRQNALINIDRETKSVTYNPDYAVMFLMSRYMRPGSVRIGSFSREADIITVEQDGCYNVLLQNDTDEAKQYTCEIGTKKYRFEIPAKSLSAVTICE